MPPIAPRLACPACGHAFSHVTHVDYREADTSTAVSVWRRRRCLACDARYMTEGTERVVGRSLVTIALEIIPPCST
jgi:transcriptional regulator NrdR family protein